MEKFSVDLPTMYGDHHVVEVRRLLLDLPGVTDVYASSSFQMVEVQFDESRLDPDEIRAKLDRAGYLGELPVPVERGATGERENGDKPYFRQTVAEGLPRAGADKSVSFAQKVPFAGRPLWPCPGLGERVDLIVDETEEEVKNG